MGISYGKSKPPPKLKYMYTDDVRDIIRNVNEKHPYVTDFLNEYPYSVNYRGVGNNSMYCIDHTRTSYTFYVHTHIPLCDFCELSMTIPKYTRLMSIKNFTFDTLPGIKQDMTVGELRDICNIANQQALNHVFKYSPEFSEWVGGNSPIPTIDMHINMETVSDKTKLTLSIRQAKLLATFLHKPYIESTIEKAKK